MATDTMDDTCPDCKHTCKRSIYIASHKIDEKTPCELMPIICTICDGLSVLKGNWQAHQLESAHQINTTAKYTAMLTSFAALQARVLEQEKELAARKLATQTLASTVTILTTELDNKVVAQAARVDHRFAELRSHVDAAMCEFTIVKFSEMKTGTAAFSTSTPLRKWGHEWWLKVEKGIDRIGLYVCIAESGVLP